MKQDGKVILLSIIVLVLFFYGGELFSVFQPSTQGFIQYTGVPTCDGKTCSWFTSSQLASPNVEINTGKNIFRFESEVEDIIEKKQCKTLSQLCSASSIGGGTPTYIDSDGCQHWKYTYQSLLNWGYYRDPCGTPGSGDGCSIGWDGSSCTVFNRYDGFYCGTCLSGSQVIEDYGGAYISTTSTDGTIYRGCYEKIKVYKNSQLIDTLYSEPTMGESSGTYYDEVSGSGVRVDIQSNWFYASVCSAYQNAYILIFSEDAFTIDITSPKEEYLQGEPIELEVSVVNNLNIITTGELLINYEVPTILGTKTLTVSQDVVVGIGENTFLYSIPTDEPLSLLRVKPKLVIDYPTTEISGVNYNFGTGEVVNINSEPSFIVGSVEEDWSEIQITSLAGYYEEQLDLTEEELALLNLSLQEKLDLLEIYSGDLDKQIELISQMELTLDEKITLVNTLTDKIDEQITLIQVMETTVDEQITIINSLSLNIESQAQMINELTDNLAIKVLLVSQLTATNEEQADLISAMELSFSDQADIIRQLDNTIQDDAIIISNLNINIEDQAQLISELELSNTEMAELITLLNLNIEDQATIISELNLSLEEQQLLVIQLTDKLEQQQALLELISSEQKFNLEDLWKDYKIAILIIGGFLFLLIITGGRRK